MLSIILSVIATVLAVWAWFAVGYLANQTDARVASLIRECHEHLAALETQCARDFNGLEERLHALEKVWMKTTIRL
jgi:hypothetical protein